MDRVNGAYALNYSGFNSSVALQLPTWLLISDPCGSY
jgi:hypothetical protein